jgi:phosphoenolpyruvate-protein phosphotransferase
MSTVIHGLPAAPGAAVAPAWVYRPPSAGADHVGLEEAATTAAAALESLADDLREAGRPGEARILAAQALMATDSELLGAARRQVEAGRTDSEAILAAGEEQAAVLAASGDVVIALRAVDVRDVAERIGRVVRGEALPALRRRGIAIAADLPPSVTAELDRDLLVGIALERGSPTAHAAILARALGIPAVVGAAGLLAAAADSGTIGIDGATGEVTIDPDPSDRQRLDAAARARRHADAADAAIKTVPLATRDGRRVSLLANIGQPDEATAAAAAAAEGIGLFRTEFMFMGRSSAPSIDIQAAAYAEALAAFPDRPVVIRMLDVGGDKDVPYLHLEPEANPFLGTRAIRLAAHNRSLLVDQLRAVLAAAQGSRADVSVMAPMVGDLAGVRLFRELIAAAGGATASLKVGIMIEVPAAVALADQLAEAVDFFSIGTNDLTQYLLAADRTNPALAALQDPMHPAVLRSIRDVVAAGHARGIPVAVCGEMAGDPVGAIALAGLGIDELSMDAASFGRVKRALAAIDDAEATRLAEAACGEPSAAEARGLFADALNRNTGEQDD